MKEDGRGKREEGRVFAIRKDGKEFKEFKGFKEFKSHADGDSNEDEDFFTAIHEVRPYSRWATYDVETLFSY